MAKAVGVRRKRKRTKTGMMKGKAGSLQGSAGSSQYKWLFMVYMQAGDESNLDSLAVQDLIELQEGVQGSRDAQGKKDGRVGENQNVVVLVQMQRKWPDRPQRYFIGPGDSVTTLKAARVENMATKESLARFLMEGEKIALTHKVTHRCLVLWGHNFGLGFGRDHGHPLTIEHLGAVLSDHADGTWLDLLATNSCTMAYIEAAFQLRESVKYVVASQVFMPPKGFPYSPIIRSISPGTESVELGKSFVTEYVNAFATSPNGEKVAMSLLDLSGVDDFRDLLKDTAGTIQAVIQQGGKTLVPDALREMQDVFLVNPVGDARPVLDLQSLAQNLVEYCGDRLAHPDMAAQSKAGSPLGGALSQLQATGERLRQATLKIGTAVPSKGKTKGNAPSLVLEHDEHPDLRPLGGIGVFAPFVVDGAARKQLDLASKKAGDLYRDLQIFAYDKDKSWPNLVNNTLRREEPDEIVSATGVVQAAERVQVNQMVGAIDAAFNTFDRILNSMQGPLVKILGLKPTRSGGPVPFGPPRLQLAGDLSLRAQQRGKPRVTVPEDVVGAFERIERALRLVERTVKSVMTNSAFGLGPPVKSEGPMGPPVKSEGPMGPPVKSEGPMGPPVKSEGPMGPPVKSEGPMGSDEMGAAWGAMTAFLSSDTQVGMLSVAVLFRALAAVLSNLEAAVSNIELAAAECQLQAGFGSALSPTEYQEAMEQRFARLFAVAAEASLQARRTVRQVMAHPVYGLGRGPEDFGQSQRDQLAASGGLSRRQLVLL